MKQVQALLRRVRSRLLRDQALAWGANGLALAALLALGVEVAYRRWPLDPGWPALAACAVLGLAVAVAGWARAWPSWREVARVADARLEGRERLTTALQFAGEGGWFYVRQRSDAAAFAAVADVSSLGPFSPPVRTLALAVVAGLGAVALALLPNPALQQLRQHRAGEAAQAAAAGQVEQVAREVGWQARPGEDPARRQALARELQQAAQDVRRAPDPQSAVASLTQAQDRLRQLQDPNQAAKKEAAASAGRQLAQNPDAARAGGALASQDLKGAAQELDRLASAVPGMGAQQRQQLAESLDRAAAAAGADEKLATSLRQGSEALRRDDVQGAQRALESAAQEARAVAAEEDFQGDVNQAINGIQQAKQPLNQQAQGQEGQGRQGQEQQGSGQQGAQAQGQGPGQQGQGQGQQSGQQGQGTPGAPGQGGGQGGTGAKPAGGSEKVYVPGRPQGGGQPDQNQPEGGQPGVGGALVPYEDVLADYQSQAISQVDRADIPEQQRQLVQQYFNELGR